MTNIGFGRRTPLIQQLIQSIYTLIIVSFHYNSIHPYYPFLSLHQLSIFDTAFYECLGVNLFPFQLFFFLCVSILFIVLKLRLIHSRLHSLPVNTGLPREIQVFDAILQSMTNPWITSLQALMNALVHASEQGSTLMLLAYRIKRSQSLAYRFYLSQSLAYRIELSQSLAYRLQLSQSLALCGCQLNQ